MKVCTKCETNKPLSHFGKDTSKRDGLHSSCKACRKISYDIYVANPEVREARRKRSKAWAAANPERAKRGVLNATLKKKYGISADQYDAMLDHQDFKCAICGSRESSWGSLAIDHCHKTGKVRGLLCFNCNTSIGKLNDDPALLRRAAEYLEESSAFLR